MPAMNRGCKFDEKQGIYVTSKPLPTERLLITKGKNNLTEETHVRHHLNQMIIANITNFGTNGQ